MTTNCFLSKILSKLRCNTCGNYNNYSFDIAVISDDISSIRFLDNRNLADKRLSTHIDLETYSFLKVNFYKSNPF